MAPCPGAEPALDGQAAQYFALLDASVEALQRRAQQLINRVNDSRKEDDAVISSFRESLLLKVGEEPLAAGSRHSTHLIGLFRPRWRRAGGSEARCHGEGARCQRPLTGARASCGDGECRMRWLLRWGGGEHP